MAATVMGREARQPSPTPLPPPGDDREHLRRHSRRLLNNQDMVEIIDSAVQQLDDAYHALQAFGLIFGHATSPYEELSWRSMPTFDFPAWPIRAGG